MKKQSFLKPTKQKGLLTLLLTIFYYVSYFLGNKVSGFFTEQLISMEEIMEIVQPMLPGLMSQLGEIMKFVVVLLVIQFIFILIVAYLFACLIVYMFKRKK